MNGGEVTLISPVFDLTGYTDPYINFTSWFYNQHGYMPLNDTLKFYLFDGSSNVLIAKKYHDNTNMSHWVPNSIRVSDFITPNSTMQLVVTLSDELATENVTEGGIDNFSITDFSLLESHDALTSNNILYPNPSEGVIQIKGITDGLLVFYDSTGRVVLTKEITEQISVSELEPGIYFVEINTNGQKELTKLIVK
ncbi:MAG: T9SS type A sorting domain-containing protein [Crocinitomicaceae bacterium]|nr:T9SS type A sorting domain-containing protein [Crocinitomicaceae bacterium]